MLKKNLALLICATLFLLPGVAAADEVADMIQRGLKLYEEGKLSQSMEELNFALAQMRQKKADALTAAFPEAPSGWTAEKAKAESAGAGLMGGGISASRKYKQDGGKGLASVEVMTDSPLIQSLAMLLSNPMFLQGGSNGKLLRVNGQKAILKEEPNNRAEVQMLVDNKILIKTEARRVENASQIAQELAKKLDLDKLRDLTK
ncbi:hypothetical protein AAU61_16380 [Desulfocarbo indianensis]|nr:hypothetical protein AAU61_16380 [Desulfocarbo indianensis]